ncbi:MAG: hypothetical protein U9R41_03700 [Candidatus Marinimicrobia bacterium]|nr:hypothetical protein [Candidatus Neomarinimicrobiota bacterium]
MKLIKFKNVKIVKVFVIILISVTSLFSFENQFFSDDSKYDIFNSQSSLYSITNNPALFKMSFNENIAKYTLSGVNKNNLFHREYSPEKEQNINFEVITSKRLNDNSTIASIIKYNRDYKFNMKHSLEKDFYGHYFSYSDTTTGNTEYSGPKLQFLYNHSINNRVFLGIKGNYGVEQGLKDVYTQCKTIKRNLDVSFGIGLQSFDKSTVIGGYIRYLDRQAKYTAVKEFTDALVRTYFGYHIYKPENPRSHNHKTDYQKGINYSLQLFKKINNLSIILNGNYGYTTNSIETGSSSRPVNVAYWQKEGGEYSGDIIYNINGGKSSFQFGYVYKQFDDWAKNPHYNTIVIKNEEEIHEFNSSLYLIPNMLMKFSINGKLEMVNQNYNEYVNPFEYNTEHVNWKVNSYFQIYLTELLSCNITGGYGKFKPHFTWNIDYFNEINIGTGIERYFRFGYIEITGMYKSYSPSDGGENINEYQIALSLRK